MVSARREGAGGVGCGKEGTEGLEEEKGEASRRREAVEPQRMSLPSERRAGEDGEWRSACRLLGTWPATADVGRKTPESTSAEERAATQRPLCSSAPHPFLPLLSPIYLPEFKRQPHSPEGLAEVAKGWAVRSSLMRAKIQCQQCCPLYGPV